MEVRYAQTNVQLLNQLREAGAALPDLVRLRDAYALAAQLFTAQHRPSGRTLLAHVVGTASIVAALGRPIDLVVAALLHAAYGEGDFGTGAAGMTEAKRAEVRRVVGETAEMYIGRYATLRWEDDSIRDLHARVATLRAIDREVLVLRLVNELEDHRDLNVLYGTGAERRRATAARRGDLLVDLAAQLDEPRLARELADAFAATGAGVVPPELVHDGADRSYVMSPRSYVRRRRLEARRIARGVLRRLGLSR